MTFGGKIGPDWLRPPTKKHLTNPFARTTITLVNQRLGKSTIIHHLLNCLSKQNSHLLCKCDPMRYLCSSTWWIGNVLRTKKSCTCDVCLAQARAQTWRCVWFSMARFDPFKKSETSHEELPITSSGSTLLMKFINSSVPFQIFRTFKSTNPGRNPNFSQLDTTLFWGFSQSLVTDPISTIEMKSLVPPPHQCRHNRFENRQLPDLVERVSLFQHTETFEFNPLDGSSNEDVFASVTWTLESTSFLTVEAIPSAIFCLLASGSVQDSELSKPTRLVPCGEETSASSRSPT